eukprot:1587856-Pyramimonas_sp.AAC.1
MGGLGVFWEACWAICVAPSMILREKFTECIAVRDCLVGSRQNPRWLKAKELACFRCCYSG